jgi:hypothetical protein
MQAPAPVSSRYSCSTTWKIALASCYCPSWASPLDPHTPQVRMHTHPHVSYVSSWPNGFTHAPTHPPPTSLPLPPLHRRSSQTDDDHQHSVKIGVAKVALRDHRRSFRLAHGIVMTLCTRCENEACTVCSPCIVALYVHSAKTMITPC